MSKKEKNLSLDNISYENGDGLSEVSYHFVLFSILFISVYYIVHIILYILYYPIMTAPPLKHNNV